MAKATYAAETATSEQLIFEKCRKAMMATEIGSFAADSLRHQQNYDFITDRLVHGITVDILRQKLVEDTATAEVHTPATWWQMLKNQYAPEWFIKRYPIKSTTNTATVKFEKYAEYPGANISVPKDKFGAAVIFEQYTPYTNRAYRSFDE